MCILCKLVSIFIGISDDDPNNKGYRGTIQKKCEHCHTIPRYVCRFNSAWLCEPCFIVMAKHFPNVVPSDEQVNIDKSKKRGKSK